jgi:hypothetical protein
MGFGLVELDLLTPYTFFGLVELDLLTPYIFNSKLEAITALSLIYTLQFTVRHALGFSVFTSRILATDFMTVSLSLQITHEVFFAQLNSFLTIILQLVNPEDSTQFYSSAPKLIWWQAGISKLN